MSNIQKYTPESITAEGQTLLVAKANWCAPCKAVTPILEEIASDHRVVIIDADEEPVKLAQLGVRGVPTMILFKDGKESKRISGMQTKETLLELFQ